MSLTITDLFCGGGGSSTGAIQVPGVEIKIAANHWDLAVTSAPDLLAALHAQSALDDAARLTEQLGREEA